VSEQLEFRKSSPHTDTIISWGLLLHQFTDAVVNSEWIMTLSQALTLAQQEATTSPRRRIFLACGFHPLYLGTFLKAHFAQRFSGQTADVETGLYGDLEGNIIKAAGSDAEAAAVIIEWSDLDSRLGLRASGGWGHSVHQDILATCHERWGRLLNRLRDLASRMPVALAAPALPTALFGCTAGWQMESREAELAQQAAAFCSEAARIENIRVVNPSHLARLSPPAARIDPKMDLGAGFPYTISHASAIALQLTHLLYPTPPMKGLITDLDDTLWAGIVGEIGAAEVNWCLAGGAQIHGLYQQQLKHLSDMGVLLAIVSKNDAVIADEALGRQDLYIPRNAFFPVSANWKPKSNAVAEILRAWNIAADSVVFVDDSAMELEEVRCAFPSMTCLRFPAGAPARVLEFLEQLRDLFGKPALGEEDALRQSSIRANALFQQAAGQASPGEFIKQLQGKLTFDAHKQPANKRLLELINKTNQFNLNGIRISEREWLQHLSDPAAFVVGVSYEDKFGPLGTIAVAAGRQSGRRLDLTAWVLSCRAFSRRIEFHILDYLFRSTGAEEIALAFIPTQRNQPLQEFLLSLGLPAGLAERVISREAFQHASHELPHQVAVTEESQSVAMLPHR
jgi:FkbH-like protein